MSIRILIIIKFIFLFFQDSKLYFGKFKEESWSKRSLQIVRTFLSLSLSLSLFLSVSSIMSIQRGWVHVRGITIWFSLSIRRPVVEQESPFLRPRSLICRDGEAIKGMKDELQVDGAQRNVAEKEIRRRKGRNRE